MYVWISVLLSIRSLVLAIFESKSWPKRALDIGSASLFAIIATVLFLTGTAEFDPAVLMILTGLIGVSLALRLTGLLRRNTFLKIGKWALFAGFWGLALVTIGLSGFSHLTEDKPVAKVVITGKRLKKWVEWKNPNDIERKKWIDTSEVVLQSPNGTVIGKYYIYGDLVAVRARVIRFRPILNFFGIPNVCHLEAIYNGYETMERHTQLPHLGYPIPVPVSMFRHLWEKGFYLNWKSSWIKSTTLESNYFPLHDSRNIPTCTSFWLTVTDGGLSSMQ